MSRKSISKKLRFEVFKRDSFTCQYCGKSAPNVVLEVDHIEPVSKGGTNDILNLVTSCFDCNRGKSDKKLSEHNELDKQLDQLKELNERKNQIEMMLQWRRELKDLDNELVEALAEEFEEETGATVNEKGKKSLKKLLKKYDYDVLCEAIEKSTTQYPDDAEKAFKKIGSIAHFTLNPQNEDEKNLYYIRGILRNRFPNVNDNLAIVSLKNAFYEYGADLDELRIMAMKAASWTDWKILMEDGGYPIEY